MLSHPLTVFEILICTNVYTNTNIFCYKYGVYATDLHECKSIGSHWIARYLNFTKKTKI